MDGGFAVIASEKDVYNRVFAISDKDYFDDTDNPALQQYMKTMSSWTFRPPLDSVKESTIVSLWKDSVISHTERFVPTDWNQNYPYNKFCVRLEGSDQYALTGCAAVAIGQVAAFHRLPESFAGYEFMWNNMIAARTIFGLDDDGQNDVAFFLGLCSSLSYTKYKDGFAQAQTDSIPVALAQLGYKNVIVTKSMNEMLKSLTEDGPVIFIGGKGYEGSGHAWVGDAERTIKHYWCSEHKDGTIGKTWISTDHYFNMNWGHGGAGNGYFKVDPNGKTSPNDCDGYVNFKYFININ